MANKTSNKKASDKKTSTKASSKTSAKASSTTPSKTSSKASEKTTKTSDNTSNNQVIFAHEEGWGVRKEGSDATTAVYDTRVEALERAREIAENQGGEVYILHTGEEPAW